MRAFALALSVALGAVLAPSLVKACPGCSNPNLPTARGETKAVKSGQISAAVSLTGTTKRVVHPETCPDIGPVCNVRAEPPQLHDQHFYMAELRPVVGVGLTSVLGVELQAPFRVVKTTVKFRRLDHTPFEPDYENIHHRNETLFGIADPWLFGSASGTLGDLTLISRTGVGVPLGSTQPDPFARGRAGLSHQHVQFGTGTFYPIFALDTKLALEPVELTAYGQAVLFVYQNRHGYLPGNRYSLGLAGDIEVVKHLRAGLAGDVINEQPERWHGLVQQDGNVGRTDILVGVNASHALDALTLMFSLKIPVYQHFIESDGHRLHGETQLTYPALVTIGAAYTFGAD
jgi:hypothetical protein